MIASEPPTSSLVANLILGQELSHHHTSNNYYSQIHKKDIDLDAFATFLEDECEDIQEVRESYYVNKYKEGITKVANGEKLWESIVPCVIELRNFIEDNVLAIASNQQFCELAIKECMNVVCLNQSVATKSIIGIIWSYINNEKATLVEEEL